VFCWWIHFSWVIVLIEGLWCWISI
jgi:hypothetical protein